MRAQQILFKEWLPDLPELNNPGNLEATNVIATDDGYVPFYPLDNAYSTAPSTVSMAFAANGATKGSAAIYFSSGLTYYRAGATGPGAPVTLGALATFGSNSGGFAQYENIVFAAGGGGHALARSTIGSAATIAAITGAPRADCVGVIGQFLVAGGLHEDEGGGTISATKSNYIQWAAVDDPTNWPVPGSSTAIASQSGEQALYEQYGPVISIHGGDQFAVILQRTAVTRMTYIGGTAVFQFDLIDSSHGAFYERGSIRIGSLTYFISRFGFCRTDGVSIENIGSGKVDKQWWAGAPYTTVTCAHDAMTGTVWFGNGSKIFIFNPRTRWWTVCNQSHTYLLTPALSLTNRQRALGYGATNILGQFAATAGSAVLTTGEAEFTPGEYTRIQGIKPLVTGAPTITVAIGRRDNLASAGSFTSEVSPTSRTGFCDFRDESRYQRARVTITGDFTKAIGIEAVATNSGDT